MLPIVFNGIIVSSSWDPSYDAAKFLYYGKNILKHSVSIWTLTEALGTATIPIHLDKSRIVQFEVEENTHAE